MTSRFDLAAAAFARFRVLPDGVPAAIRAAVLNAMPGRSRARVLDLGAGTGRIGKVFVDANDAYIGVDDSRAMLREFAAGSGAARLVQGRGQQLPFRGGTFDVVLLMQVLSGADDWRALATEACRVLARSGAIVVGQTHAPPDGVDAQLRRQLAAILDGMGIAAHRPQQARKQSLAWLESSSVSHVHAIAAAWTAAPSPRDFLERHRTGARFSALPAAVREAALQQLTAWAQDTFGSLDGPSAEAHSFELDVFEFSHDAAIQ